MRVRDMVRGSFRAAMAAGLLESYEHSGRFDAPERFGSVWRHTQLRDAFYGQTGGPLYADHAEWQRAYRFVQAFTAAEAARRSRALPVRLERCFGSFGAMAPDDVFHHISFALEACGMKKVAVNAISQEGIFEAFDSAKLESLPEPYGKWLMLQERQRRWGEPVSLGLSVHCRVTTGYASRGGRLETAVTLSLSAPAIALVDEMEMLLQPQLELVRGRIVAPASNVRLFAPFAG
jgi:hypothetical protein